MTTFAQTRSSFRPQQTAVSPSIVADVCERERTQGGQTDELLIAAPGIMASLQLLTSSFRGELQA